MSSVSRNSLKIFLFIFFLFPSIAQAAITVLHNVINHLNDTTLTYQLPITSSTAGDLIVVACCPYIAGGTAPTVSGVSDSSGNNYTHAINSASVGNSNQSTCDIWYLNSSSSGTTSVTCTYAPSGGAVILKVQAELEFTGLTNSPTYDKGGVVNNGTGSVAGADSGPTLLTTGVNEIGVAVNAPFHSVTQNPKTGNTWNAGGGAGMIDSTGVAATGLIAISPGSTQPVWQDSNASDEFNCSAATWYVSPTTTSSVQGNSTIRGNSTVN